MQTTFDNKALGNDIRQDPMSIAQYRQLKDWRNNARNIERRISLGDCNECPISDWQQLANLTIQLLSECHDYELAAWLSEALLRIDGYLGLSNGFKLITHIANSSGEQAYPTPDEDSTWKVQAITALNGEGRDGVLITPLYQVNVLCKDKLALWQFQQSLNYDTNNTSIEYREQKISAGIIPPDEIEKIISNEDLDDLTQQLNAIETLNTTHQDMTSSLDAALGSLSPPSSQITQHLKQIHDLMYKLRDLHPLMKVTREQTLNSRDQSSSTTTAPKQSIVVIKQENPQRDQAIQLLKQAIDYFMTHEPHSPVPFLIQRAINWSTLSFPELISKLIDSEEQLIKVCALTGATSNHSQLQAKE